MKMALTSPGVDVQVIDESFYTPAEPGTVPIIFVATGENKLNGAGTGIAPGTTKANAGKPYLLTSQRELVDTFGDPTFYVDNNNNPIHGGEQNEYGLQAAYSYLGVSNRAYVVRADIDLNGLNASSTATTANPAGGTYWLDTATSRYGVFEWDGSAVDISNTTGQSFSGKTPIVVTDTTKVVDYAGADYTPKGSVGAVGDYALVAVTTVPTLYYKNTAGTWVVVGSADWKASWPSVTSTKSYASTPTPFVPGDNFTVNETDGVTQIFTFALTGNTPAQFVIDFNAAATGSGISAAVVNNRLEFYNDGSAHDGFEFAATGTILADAGLTGAVDYNAPKLQASAHTSVPEFKSGDTTPRPTGSVWVKTTTPNAGANWSVKVWNEDTELWDTSLAPIYATNHAALAGLDLSGGGSNLTSANLYVQVNVTEAAVNLADFTIYKRAAAGATSIMSAAIGTGTITAGTGDFTISESVKGSATMSTPVTVSFTAAGTADDADTLAEAINAAGLTNVSASVGTGNKVIVTHALGGDMRIADTNGKFVMAFPAWNYTNSTGTANFYSLGGSDYVASLWKELTYTASDEAPTALAEDGALWYSSVIDEVDIMVHDGSDWKGYLNEYASADPAGPIVSATEPEKQSDGTTDLVTGDLWVSTADLENFPRVYRWNATLSSWIELDTTDQTTENGIIFADARYNTAGANSGEAGDIADLLASDYLDPDAPDPALYPKGMLLWNLRRSGFNVKRFERNYIDISATNGRASDESMAGYYPHRWVTESANEADGSGSFGRKAQRKVVVQALQAMLNENQDIRDDESRIFNLIATPGYPELIGEMITLNYDRGLTAFVIGDSPMRLTSDATSLNEWASNVNTVVEDNDNGLVSRDEYLGVYYPSGFTSDNAGNNIVVPSSHMVLRTFALNDQVAYPWFAPAGTRRGGVTNATSTGYINSEGEFVATALNEGVRDTLYSNNVNPITFLTGAGLVVFGQKTRARNASALDRINVARLVVYLRSQLNTLAKPYLFEPNDKITRDEIKQQVESLLVELVGLRALFDFLVVCDETNNTPARIDRNELYVDIAIEPVKAVEFIYIPLRIKNTGEIAGL